MTGHRSNFLRCNLLWCNLNVKKERHMGMDTPKTRIWQDKKNRRRPTGQKGEGGERSKLNITSSVKCPSNTCMKPLGTHQARATLIQQYISKHMSGVGDDDHLEQQYLHPDNCYNCKVCGKHTYPPAELHTFRAPLMKIEMTRNISQTHHSKICITRFYGSV